MLRTSAARQIMAIAAIVIGCIAAPTVQTWVPLYVSVALIIGGFAVLAAAEGRGS